MADSMMRVAVCRRCGGFKPLSEFDRTQRGRRRRCCRTCRQRIESFAPVWDWACAIKKATKMHVAHAHGREGKYMLSLDEKALRAIMAFQEETCPLSGRRFYLPSAEDLKSVMQTKTGKNVTLSQWIKSMTLETLQGKVIPVLVRLSRYGNWQVGNVTFIASVFEPLSRSASNLEDVRQWIHDTTSKPLRVATPELLEEWRQMKEEVRLP